MVDPIDKNPDSRKKERLVPGQTVFLSKTPKSITLADVRKEPANQHLMEHQLVSSLQEISKVLAVEASVQKILEGMATILAKALKAKWLNFWTLTPDKKAVYIAAHYGMQPEYIENSRLHPVPLGTGWIGKAVQTKQAWGSSDLQRDARLGTVDKSWVKITKKQGVRAVICVPVISGGKALGGMCTYYPRSHNFTYFEMQLATIVTNQAATSLENARIHKELQGKMSEVERFNKLAIGRELKMVELKNKIAELESGLKVEERK